MWRAAEARIAGNGRLLLRYSGTEALARVMVEGADAALVDSVASDLAVATSERASAPEPVALPLEPSDDELRRLLDDAVRRVVAHVGSLAAQPADGTAGAAALARALIEREAPEDGAEPAGPLLDLLFEEAIPASFNNAGPGFLAYIPGGGQPYAAVADLDLRRA